MLEDCKLIQLLQILQQLKLKKSMKSNEYWYFIIEMSLLV